MKSRDGYTHKSTQEAPYEDAYLDEDFISKDEYRIRMMCKGSERLSKEERAAVKKARRDLRRYM